MTHDDSIAAGNGFCRDCGDPEVKEDFIDNRCLACSDERAFLFNRNAREARRITDEQAKPTGDHVIDGM